MESWIIDIRYALRRLRTRPLYAALAVMTLALGVGGAAAITGVARTLLVKPLPYAAEQELGIFWNTFDWSEQEFLYLRARVPGLPRGGRVPAGRSDAAARGPRPPACCPGSPPPRSSSRCSAREPLLGRGFRKGDDVQGGEAVAVLSYGLWQELGGDPSIIGRRAPARRRAAHGRRRDAARTSGSRTRRVRVWLAQPLDPEDRSGNYALVGRVAPGRDGWTGLAPHLGLITARLDERYDYPAQWDKTKNAR